RHSLVFSRPPDESSPWLKMLVTLATSCSTEISRYWPTLILTEYNPVMTRKQATTITTSKGRSHRVRLGCIRMTIPELAATATSTPRWIEPISTTHTPHNSQINQFSQRTL